MMEWADIAKLHIRLAVDDRDYGGGQIRREA